GLTAASPAEAAVPVTGAAPRRRRSSRKSVSRLRQLVHRKRSSMQLYQEYNCQPPSAADRAAGLGAPHSQRHAQTSEANAEESPSGRFGNGATESNASGQGDPIVARVQLVGIDPRRHA